MTEDPWCSNCDREHRIDESCSDLDDRRDECLVESISKGDPYHPCVCGCMLGHIGQHHCRCGHHWLPVRPA